MQKGLQKIKSDLMDQVRDLSRNNSHVFGSFSPDTVLSYIFNICNDAQVKAKAFTWARGGGLLFFNFFLTSSEKTKKGAQKNYFSVGCEKVSNNSL